MRGIFSSSLPVSELFGRRIARGLRDITAVAERLPSSLHPQTTLREMKDQELGAILHLILSKRVGVGFCQIGKYGKASGRPLN
jgi:hypothetical protein